MKATHLIKVCCIQTCIMLVKSNFVTSGHFFQAMENDAETSLEKDEIFIKSEFFSCNKEEKCSRVLQEKGLEKKYFPGEDQSSSRKDKTLSAVWKKMKQPGDCKDLYDSGKKESGVYHITRPKKQVIKVYCDMEKDGGGWTVIQRRIDGSTDFNRGWFDYKHGFGDVEKNMWIGLENMHSLASPKAMTNLRIELKHWLKGDKLFVAKYGSFAIGNETDGYTLNVSKYSGTAGDSFNDFEHLQLQNNGQKFSTLDRDNDQNVLRNCAADYEGGWWYNAATSSQLNGWYPYSENSGKQYMTWSGVAVSLGNIKFSEMKIRRN